MALPEVEPTELTCIIVVDVGRKIDILVDTVSEVLDVAGENIDLAPDLSGCVDTSFILGMGKVGEAAKILLDIDKVMTTDELVAVAASTTQEATPAAESG